MSEKRKRAEARGREGEDRAAQWLEEQGWAILDRRRKTPVGEIDIVCRKAGLVAFVEVKWRASEAELDYAIDHYRLRRVAAAAEAVAHEYAGQGEDISIDVILLAPGASPRHIANATLS